MALRIAPNIFDAVQLKPSNPHNDPDRNTQGEAKYVCKLSSLSSHRIHCNQGFLKRISTQKFPYSRANGKHLNISQKYYYVMICKTLTYKTGESVAKCILGRAACLYRQSQLYEGVRQQLRA